MSSLPFARPAQAKHLSLIATLLALIVLLALPALALAHPLGNFTINRYSRLEIGGEQITLVYVVDMAEIPTQQERPQIDVDGDGVFSPAEQEDYLALWLPQLQENLYLMLNGRAQQWVLSSHALSFPEGQAGLPTLRMRAEFVADVRAAHEAQQVAYHDANFSERLGWQEVVIRGLDGIDLLGSTTLTEEISQELTSYPDDLLQSPPVVNQADFQYRWVGSGSAVNQSSQVMQRVSADTGSPTAALVRGSDPFTELIHLPTLGPWTLFVALLAAFGWGAAHALSPGHGKTIVGAYLVGSRGTAKHALFLGLTTTITHTAGVFALGLVTLFASRYVLPEALFPWLSLLSGLMVVLIGLSMAWSWLRRLPTEHVHAHHEHHEHQHGHEHDHHHDHGHDHHVPNGLHTHDGIHYHSHDVPGQDGSPVTWRSLLALGVSGGLLPCPSALVVMLGAIALERVAFGLVLIVAFSLGLAGVLTAFGLALVYAGKLFTRLPESGRLLRFMPVASALFITAVGVGITWQALVAVL